MELQRHGTPDEKAAEGALIELAYARDIPLVATNEPYFARREDYDAHDALIAIAEGRVVAETDRRQLTSEHYFKSRAEMAALFADLPEALASTVEIAQRCAFRPRRAKADPAAVLGSAIATPTRPPSCACAPRRAWCAGSPRMGWRRAAPSEEYRDRLAFELKTIEGMKYPGYFLIVSDFISWAKEQGIPVGPGRGSGAGSLVAYSLLITDLDPLRFDLLFERFLNPERVSMPDFDIDFCQDRRDEVIRYVQERYGRDQVAQIITFGTLQARGVLRDVGRVLEMPYGQVDKLCKLVPQNPAAPVTLAKAIEGEPKLQAERDSNPIVKRAFDIALKLEGLYRHASTHAAGIVIGDRPLSELVPMYRDPKSDMPVTQFNMKWVEQAGLVKFDFLGLKTLTVLQTAVRLLKQRGIELDLAAIPLDDKKTYDQLSRAEAVGLFQLESPGMRRALLDMKPDRFEDIIALVALYRPGPMANIPTYCARKHGDEDPEYIHPKLEPILKETYGVIVYQEQVMQAAQILAGYTLGQADLLRRAMGKKIRSEMAAQRKDFVKGATDRGIDRAHADAIFDLLERFAEYGFNKSHAAAYALVAYQTAYLKANYPVEFMAASMTLDMGNTDKLSEFRAEARAARHQGRAAVGQPLGRRVRCRWQHHLLRARRPQGRRRVRRSRASSPRAATSRSRDLTDFARRINPQVGQQARAGKPRRLRRLRGAGAEPRQGAMPPSTPCCRPRSAPTRRCRSARTICSAALSSRETIAIPAVEPWLSGEKLQREYDAVGFFLSGHPLDEYAALLAEAEGAVLDRVLPLGEIGRQRRPGRRHRGVAPGAAHQDRQQDGHLRPVRSDRPLRGDRVRRRLAAVPRHPGAGLAGAAVPHRRGAGR